MKLPTLHEYRHRWPLHGLITFVWVEGATLWVGLSAAALSLFFVNHLSNVPNPALDGFSPWWFYLGSGCASLVVGPLYWARWKNGTMKARAGAWLGAACGLIAHPLTWLVVFTLSYIRYPGTSMGFVGSAAIFVIECATFTLVSLLYVGWLTALIGALAGAANAWVMRLTSR